MLEVTKIKIVIIEALLLFQLPTHSEIHGGLLLFFIFSERMGGLLGKKSRSAILAHAKEITFFGY